MSEELIKLTEAAKEHIQTELAKNGATGIRFGIRFGGCQGLTYSVDYITEIESADIHLVIDDINIYIEPKAVLFLEGMTVDFKTSALSSSFVFENPNAIKKCGCGLSFCSKDSSGNGGNCNGQCQH